MATCSVCNDGKRLTAHGLKIHMGKIHGVHYGGAMAGPAGLGGHEMLLREGGITQPALVPCPCLFCKVRLPQEELRAHWARDHPTWKLHTGLYTWEV